MQCGDGTGLQVPFVSEEDVIVRVPAVLVPPCELQSHDVTRDSQPPLQSLPGASSGDLRPGRSLGFDQSGEWFAEVMRNRDGYQTRDAAGRLPGVEGGSQLVGAPAPDFGRADGHSHTLPQVSTPQ